MAGRGQPRKITNEKLELYLYEYFEYIYNSQSEDTADVPTFYGFYRFVNAKTPCAYRTIQRCFDEYCPDYKKDFELIRSDLLVRGTSLGKYQPTIVIFALKNWCSWSDRTETVQLTADDVKQDALSKSLEDMAEELTSDD